MIPVLKYVFVGLLLSWFLARVNAARWLKVGLGLLVVPVVLLMLPAINNPLASYWESRVDACDVGRADVKQVVVIAGGLSPPTRNSKPSWAWLSSASLARLAEAVRWRGELGVPLLISGGVQEVSLMAELALLLDVPPAMLSRDDSASTTRTNAVGVSRSATKSGTLMLVTSAIHMPRAQLTFEAMGLEICPMPVDYRAWNESSWAWLFPNVAAVERADALLHEWAGLIYYRLKGWI